MFIGIDKIFELIDSDRPLIENLSNKEKEAPEGSGIDLSVAIVSKFKESSAFLGIEQRSTLATEIIADTNSQTIYELHPQEYILVTTNEILNMPSNLVGIIRPRGTLFRSGIILSTGQVNPEYSGQLTFGMLNASPYSFKFEIGARVAHILFAEVNGKTEKYRGQWNGGRISAPSLEEQV